AAGAAANSAGTTEHRKTQTAPEIIRNPQRHPGRAVTPYPGSQKALAFVTVPGNALGVSGMTQRSNLPDGV
ncbi:MAG: hypothetical protein WB610_13025, partial [Rhodomicrobium sp.]